MNRDELTEHAPTVPPADERISFKPVAATGAGGRERRRRMQGQPVTMATPIETQRAPSAFSLPDTTSRHGPTYPAWEKPPTPYKFPRLRGREEGKRAIWPLLAAALGVIVVLGVLVIYPTLTGHKAYVAVATPTRTPGSSSSASLGPNDSASVAPEVTPSHVPTTVPGGSFAQYKVKSGDNLTKVAKAHGLKTWELLAANPSLKPPSYTLRVGAYLNIPLPGQMQRPSSSASPKATAS